MADTWKVTSDSLTQAVDSTVDSLTAPIKNTASGVQQAGQNAKNFSNPGSALQQGVNDIFAGQRESKTSSAIGAVSNFFANTSFSTQQLDKFQSGGFNYLQEQGVLKLDSVLNTFASNPTLSPAQALSASLDTDTLFSGLGSDEIGALTSAIERKLGTFTSPGDFVLDFGFDKLNNIIGGFSNIENFVTNTINVIPKDFESILGAVGGEFDVLRELIEAFEDRSGISLDLDISGSSPGNYIANPLKEYNTFNYIITLGVLTINDVNNPQIIRDDSFKKIICKSAGGQIDKRHQIPLEQDLGIHAEYFIDNLRTKAVIQPNTRTGISLGTDLSFEIQEPYSMGNFLQALVEGAADLGYENFNDAPFCIKIDFIGYESNNEQGGSLVQTPAFIPIQILDVGFEVSGQGSFYNVSCVPLSEIALGDTAATTLSDITATGSTVAEILNGPDKSVAAVLNQRIDTLEDVDAIPQGDRYVICFPKDPGAIQAIVEGEFESGDATTEDIDAAEQTRIEKGLAERPEESAVKKETLEEVVVTSENSIFQNLDAFSRNKDFMNPIGLSLMLNDDAEGGNQSVPDTDILYEENGDQVDVNNPEAAPAQKTRTKSFATGSRVDEIIEKVLVDSEYAAENAEEVSENGVRKMYRINTHVYFDTNEETVKKLGRSPKIFVYVVVPFYADEASFTAPNAVAPNRGGIKKAAVKEYNYIYTGKNDDVMQFDINFNNAFLQEAYANFGMNQGARSSAGSDRKTYQNTGEQDGASTSNAQSERKALGGGQVVESNRMTITGDSRTTDIRKRLAETFHHRLLNSDVDLITANMTIMGDPYYIPTQTGNFVGERDPNSPSITQDGYMTYLENQVYVNVNFKTPIDYSITGDNVVYSELVPEFSGVFQVLDVENIFEGGKFYQELGMVRSRAQEVEGESGTFVTSNSDATVNDNPLNSEEGNSGENGQDPNTDQPCNSFEQLETKIGDAIDNVASNLFPDLSTVAGDAVMSQIPSVTVAGITWSPSKSLFTAPPQIKAELEVAQDALDQALENSPIKLRGLV